MYMLQEEEGLSFETIIRQAVSAADLALDLDADADAFETDGWGRHAKAANGFGDDGVATDD